MTNLSVSYFHRRPGPKTFSLERVFADVRAALPEEIEAKVLYCPWDSKGIIRRVLNILWARLHAAPVNHITGDVHYLCYLLPKRRTVLTIADCVSLEHNRGLKRWLLWLFWYWFPARRSRVITVISQFTKDNLLTHLRCPPDKIVVIHCPASETFRLNAKPFKADCPAILQIGTGWNKNVQRVAAALKGVRCRLIIVGALDEAQRQCLADSNVRYNNYEGISDRELADLYGECDLVVFASLYEGFGLPIVEAQAVGRPVVTSNRCSMPEVAGGAACLVEPESIESIREGIVKVIGDLGYREDLIKKGFENVKRFAPVRIAAQYAELYRALTPLRPNLGG
jgi:glycosyltransferase involved in cell wall biosynthesis